MLPVTYKEHSVIVTIKDVKPTGKILLNMSDGKPFLMNNKLFVCFDSQIYEVTDAKYEDEIGNILQFDDLIIDTNIRVGGVIINDGKVLLLHRVKKDQEYYVFPGGHVLKNERAEDALLREIKEETGLDIAGKPLVQIYTSKNEEFGEEIYFKVSGLEDFSNLKKINPDVREGDVNESVWISVKNVQKMDNVFPKGVVLALASSSPPSLPSGTEKSGI